jgi:hypothetical protein
MVINYFLTKLLLIMKKSVLIIGILCSFCGVSFAKKKVEVTRHVAKKELSSAKRESSNQPLGRQCCTVSEVVDFGGGIVGIVSATACSGSFLTSDAVALSQACQRASDALSGLLNFQ